MELSEDMDFHPGRLKQNILFLNDFFSRREMSWTFVIKAFHNYPDFIITELANLPCQSIASDNPRHLDMLKKLNPNLETWFLNYEGSHDISEFIDVNLTHSAHSMDQKSCLMLAIDEVRHGESFKSFSEEKYSKVGAYLDCEKLPDLHFFEKWKKLKISSGILQSIGTSVSFEIMDYLQDIGVNHYRLGELVLTGKGVEQCNNISGMRQDVFEASRPVSYNLISNIDI